jgi:UDP-glucose 4-epimerase
MKTLIIGATGSTGLYLTDYFVSKNHNLVVTGLKPRNLQYYKSKGIEYISLDISKKEEFVKLPTDINCVVLLAGMMPARMEGYNPYKYININTIGTLNTLEFCRINNITKIIFAQSHSDVFGYWNTGEYIKDDSARKLNYKGDHAVYIISKCASVDLIEHYHQDYGIQSIIFRLPTIYCYWPDDTMYVNGIKKTMAYLTIIKKAIKGEAIEIWGNPKIAKDIVYVKDFVQLVEEAIKSNTAQGIYNVGTGIPTTLEEQIRGIIEIFSRHDKTSVIVYRPDKPSQISYLYDVSKAKKELGYQVRYPYIEMLKDMKAEMNNPWFSQIINQVL